MSIIDSAKQCGCQEIAAFYQEALQDSKNGIMAIESVGPLKGLFVRYVIPTLNGSVQVTCNNGLDTFGFNQISIGAFGFVRTRGSGVSLEVGKYSATSIEPVNPDGSCKITTLFSNAKLVLPKSDFSF